MNRLLIALLVLVVAAPVATADVVVVKKGNRYLFIGLKSEYGGTKVDINNWQVFADQSTGVIEREGYDGVWVQKSAKAKPVKYPIGEVVDRQFTTEPPALLDGFDFMSTGAWAQAIRAFRSVASDAGARPVYQGQAKYFIGRCYLAAGSTKQAEKHYAGWDLTNSRYTPEVYQIMGKIKVLRKKYGEARQWFDKIAALEGIPTLWKLKSRLGGVEVDIAENKLNNAEQNAKAIAQAAVGKVSLNDAQALAKALQAEAIMKGGAEPRIREAEQVARQATDLKKIENVTAARAWSVLGNAIYMQKKPDEARYAYMRVVTLYPEQSDFVANALLEAGNCFLDLSGAAKDDQAKSDDLLIKGIKLMRECSGRHRGRPAASQASSVYRKRKADYEAALARVEKKQ
ncbi:MAG: tetratricopeptide repeat protein [Planctomycetota bacterium]|jgi:tetratricopeptide (TPR) repeat protein